jgi:hypothetical protein
MTQPESVKRQIEEAQQAYQAAYMAPQADPPPEPEKPPEPIPDAAGQVHDWKLRFTNYKASADREIASLRQAVAGLQQQLSSAVESLNAAKAERERAQARVVPEELLSEQERDLLGDENLAVVAKVADAKAQAKVSALEGEIQQLKEALSFYSGREMQRDHLNAEQDLRQRMARAYPDWEKFDNDDRFKSWMHEPDPLTGRRRIELFQAARQASDVGRLAAFYREYGETVGRDPRAEMLQPPSRPGKEAPPQGKRIWSNDLIGKFYRDKAAGVFKPEEAAALQQDIFDAQREGRIRP